ncbi:MAG: DNA primase, partial [Gammaproteobacteria bacterium]
FTVSTEKQFYHCFGCGAHGTALGFLIEYEHLTFPEAVEALAQSVGLQVPYEGGDQSSQREGSPLYDALEAANRFYQAQLRQHPQGPGAVDYLKKRGLSGEVAKRYGLGFAPPGYETLIPAIGKQWPSKQLVEAGLLTEGERGRPYDRFRDRVMFPIRDRRGRVIGFGGRVMGDGEPKYLNSPETPVFHKGRELYGFYEARTSGAKLDSLIVVEGYMDVVSLAQFGVNNAVAALGTSITKEQVELCFRSVQSIVFCFDGDRAGRAAAWRAAENALPALSSGKTVRFLFLPEGHDPDSLIRERGLEAFSDMLQAATSYSSYFFSALSDGLDLDSVDGRAALVKKGQALINQIREPIFRELMVEELAKLARTQTDRLDQFDNESRPQQVLHRTSNKRPVGKLDPSRSPIRQALALLLFAPELAQQSPPPTGLEKLETKGAALLMQLIELAQSMSQPNSAALLERLREHPARDHLVALMEWTPVYTRQEYEAAWRGVLEKLENDLITQRWQALTSNASLNEQEKAELRELQVKRLRRTQASGDA